MQKLKDFFHTYLGEVALWAFITVVSGILGNFYKIPEYICWACFALALLVTLKYMAYAWIINPINMWKAKHKK